MKIKHGKNPNLITFFVPMVIHWIIDGFTPIKKIAREEISIDPSEVRVWRIGHATMLINFYGTTILTDPVFTNWIPIPKRIVAPGIALNDLPNLDYILVSHAHWDHFSVPSLEKLADKTETLIVPKNCSDLVKHIPFKRVVELPWGEPFIDKQLTFNSVEPQHWGQRMPWEKVIRFYNSIIIEKNGKAIFFGGDTGYGPFFKEVGETYNIDIAILGIGSYCPQSFEYSHKNPEQAVQAMIDLGAKYMTPMHYGDIRLSLEPMSEPPIRLKAAAKKEGLESRIHILDNGKSFKL